MRRRRCITLAFVTHSDIAYFMNTPLRELDALEEDILLSMKALTGGGK